MVRWNSHINISLCVNIYLSCSFQLFSCLFKNKVVIFFYGSKIIYLLIQPISFMDKISIQGSKKPETTLCTGLFNTN